MEDKNIVCVDCKTEFLWTVGEQNWYQSMVNDGKFKNFVAPVRCFDCREIKKAKRLEAEKKLQDY